MPALQDPYYDNIDVFDLVDSGALGALDDERKKELGAIVAAILASAQEPAYVSRVTIADSVNLLNPEEKRYVGEQLIAEGVSPEKIRTALSGKTPLFKRPLFVGIVSGLTGVALGFGACWLYQKQRRSRRR